APEPGSLAQPLPPALFILHPPAETKPSLPEADGVASGVLWLPGLPELGLEHRAAWVEAEADGTVTRLVSAVDADLWQDADLAVRATPVAAWARRASRSRTATPLPGSCPSEASTAPHLWSTASTTCTRPPICSPTAARLEVVPRSSSRGPTGSVVRES